ncbi:DUF6090 family protein [Hanstruepera ponticola]|uniref:DUF6090 family protein n=1 Tax=Hanstruepera ponticola TaxID=2042995 RepID=UPI000CF17809|nr:DUF6090 family protein [Hanstruepera ponticola]
MIKFFRNIRKKLLNEGKTSRYFKYAIGEIILVVIGILIALQINNWNEKRKSNKMAYEVYTNLLTSLEQDSIEVERTVSLLTKSLETQKKLILNQSNQFTKQLNQNDLDKMVQEVFSGVMSFFPKTGVYELITSNNSMDLLQSENIKSLLINLYDFQYKRYENVDAIVDYKYHYHLGSLIRKKLGFIVEYNSESKLNVIKGVDPVQFNAHYDELVSECQDVYGVLSTSNNYLIEIKKSINELQLLIRKELKDN